MVLIWLGVMFIVNELNERNIVPLIYLILAVAVCLSYIVGSGLAINFHRYFLANQRDLSWKIFHINWSSALRYFGFILLIGFILAIINLPFRLMEAYFDALPDPNGEYVSIALSFVGTVLIGWLQFRYCLAFPGVAMNVKMGLGGSWDATRGHNLALFWLSVYLVLIVIILTVVLVSSYIFLVIRNPVFVLMAMNSIWIWVIGGVLGGFALFYISIFYLGIATEFYHRYSPYALEKEDQG